MDGVQLPQGYSHFEEAVYFLPLKKLFYNVKSVNGVTNKFCHMTQITSNIWSYNNYQMINLVTIAFIREDIITS